MSERLLELLHSEAKRTEQEYNDGLYLKPRAYIELAWKDPAPILADIQGMTLNFCPITFETEIAEALISIVSQLKPLGHAIRCVISSYVCVGGEPLVDKVFVVAMEAGFYSLCGSFDVVLGSKGMPVLAHWRVVENGPQADPYVGIFDSKIDRRHD